MGYNSVRTIVNPGELGASRSGRLIQSIRRDMDIKDNLFRHRRRNEEVLSLSYLDGTTLGGAAEWVNIRENALNLPYRYLRWLESQATSKKAVVKVNRDAGAGQRPGGQPDTATGMWVGITLGRVAYEAGFPREIKALIGEVVARGTSVMRIGYHEQEITLQQAQEAGKDAQSIVADVLGSGDMEAKVGQAHLEISDGMMTMAEDPLLQKTLGQRGVEALLTRKESHDVAAYSEESKDIPRQSTRLIQRKIWMQKRRVGEDVGWAPWVYDVEDSPYWWERHVWTKAEVKASPLFTPKFKREVQGYDGRNISGVMRGGQTPSTENMGNDARHAQSEDVLDDDEKMVEWFSVWKRMPNLRSGGIVQMVSPETPDEFIHADDSNPHVDAEGNPLIPGFYPFYHFTPVLSTITVPERTVGIPPIAVGMPQFEKIAEYNRLRHESALRHSLRLYDVHPAHKDNKRLLDALKNGEDGYANLAKAEQYSQNGQLQPSVVPIQFTGNTQEIDRQAAREEGDWIKVMGMPPAVLQGMGTAETATQDQQGIAAGERESRALISYFQDRMGDVMAGVRGLVRGNMDDEDFISLLGQEGAEVMKAWQIGSTDDGDEITFTFGVNAQAQEVVEKKQLMEAITLEKGEIEPLSGLPVYDSKALFEELHRRMDVGPPVMNEGVLAQLQQMVLALAAQIQQLTGVNPVTGQGAEGPSKNGKPTSGERKGPPQGGPRPSEGDGPTQGNISSGAQRGTLRPSPQGAMNNN